MYSLLINSYKLMISSSNNPNHLFIRRSITEVVVRSSVMKLVGVMHVLMWAAFLISFSSIKVFLVITKSSLPIQHSPAL